MYASGQPVKYYYDYFLKDHLGNVRTVLTEQTDLSVYTATMEAANAATETALFSNVEETRNEKPVGYPEDEVADSNNYVAKLNAKDGGKKIGPSLVLKVMAGDTIQIGARAFYKSTGPKDDKSVTPEDMVASLLQALGGKAGEDASHASRQADQVSPLGNFNGNDYQRLKEKDPDQNKQDKPKAYLNFVLFDDQFNLVEENSGVRQVKGEPDQLQTLAVDKMAIEKSGFLYVYTSNETQQDVLFDNVTVAAVSGPLLEETHYYPFGLTMAGISSNALKGVNYQENRKKYNGIEFTKDLDLDIYDAQLRNLDPQIGRWNQVDPKIENMEMWSPYASNYDNPIRYNDFLGDEPDGGPGDPSYYARADNKGAIISANQQEYDQNPVGAFLKDAFHLAAEVTGLNTLDDFIHNRVVGENSPKQVAIETAQLGVSLSRGKGGGPGEIGRAENVKAEVSSPKGEKTFQTYTKKGPNGEVYSGRTSGTGTPRENVAKRDQNHHMNKEGYGPAQLDKSSKNKDAIRGREQQKIDQHGGAKSQGGTSGNQVNGISPNNPRKDRYMKAAKDEGW